MFFNLFKKKPAGITVVDKVWMSTQAKWNACAETLAKMPDTIFVCWFEETMATLTQKLQQVGHQNANAVILYRQVSLKKDHPLVFVEHYPLAQKEQEIFASAGLLQATVYSSLDEPFFSSFGGERMIEMLKRMGTADNESIEHKMISKSIYKAQQKLASKTAIDNTARSQGEWIRKNIDRNN